jgi:hypothetical protein
VKNARCCIILRVSLLCLIAEAAGVGPPFPASVAPSSCSSAAQTYQNFQCRARVMSCLCSSAQSTHTGAISPPLRYS